jgi:hypothetical protein
MKYPSHKNSLEVYCAECGKDITLDGQYIWLSKVYCEDCNENGDEETAD